MLNLNFMRHSHYNVPDGLYVKSTASKFAKKVDLRGTRGQAVLPPTIHKSGKVYEWHYAGEPCEMPDPEKIPLLPEPWVKALIDTENAYFPGQEQKTTAVPIPFTGEIKSYGRAALEAEVNLVAAAPDGTRNDVLNKAAFALGQLVAGGELDQGTVESELTSASAAAGLDSKEITKTIRSGMNAGAKSPREAPVSTLNRDTGGTCDTTQNEASRQDPPIDKGCDTGGTCDAISKDKKTFALPEPQLDSFPPDIESALLNIAETKQCPPEVPTSALLALVSAMVGRARGLTIKKGWSGITVHIQLSGDIGLRRYLLGSIVDQTRNHLVLHGFSPIIRNQQAELRIADYATSIGLHEIPGQAEYAGIAPG